MPCCAADPPGRLGTAGSGRVSLFYSKVWEGQKPAVPFGNPAGWEKEPGAGKRPLGSHPLPQLCRRRRGCGPRKTLLPRTAAGVITSRNAERSKLQQRECDQIASLRSLATRKATFFDALILMASPV